MDSGTKVFRSKFLIKERKILDCEFYKAYPVMAKFCLPGDLWKISSNIFIRLQPMLSPSLTPMAARLRYFFVPLRLVEPNTELIITGSEEGYWSRDKQIPEFEAWKIGTGGTSTITKDSLISIMTGLPPGTYDTNKIMASKHFPADYWRKGYARLWWDYYRDENLFSATYTNITKFDYFINSGSSPFASAYRQGNIILPVCLPHDYFTSSLPWQLKGVAPAINFSVTGLTWKGVGGDLDPASSLTYGSFGFAAEGASATDSRHGLINSFTAAGGSISEDDINSSVQAFLSNIGGNVSGAFTTADLRDMTSQTRVFERLARCGSRYTEYLRANFNTSPADETLQRAQYLGGYKVPILTTEVLQTAGAVNSSDQQTPVGTLRGKGITNGGERIKPFFCKEFGLLYAILDVRPALQYTQGVPREFTYRSRFDFFNPSFQHLSEQEVRNGEIFFGNDYIDNDNSKPFVNDSTWGFQAYANELRTGKTMIVGNMRDSLDFWHQALKFVARPALNWAFLNGTTHAASWNRPFEVIENTQPIIADVYNFCEAHRPMVRYGTPGLVDHL